MPLRTPLGVAGAAAIAAVAAVALDAHARPEYPTYVPTPYGCETCHRDPNDRLNRNGFGIDFAITRGLWVDPVNPAEGLCWLDSDADGLSNGVELADPMCQWRRGNARPVGRTSHPGEASDPGQCGDGALQEWEECDGLLFAESCVDRGYVGGEVRCYIDCTIDVRRCELPPPPDRGLPDMAPPVDAEVAPDAAPPEADAATTPDLGDPSDRGAPADAALDMFDGAFVDGALDLPDGALDRVDGALARDAAPEADADEGGDLGDDMVFCAATPRPTRWPGAVGALALLALIGWRRRR